jgi:hypothetical protein
MSAFSQQQHYEDAFQRIGNNGYFRFVGDVGYYINFSNLQKYNVERYTDKQFVSAEFSTIIKGEIIYIVSVINTPVAIQKIMEDKLKPYEAGSLCEFIFPYEKGQYTKGYLLVATYAQETWGYLDCAQAFFIRTE